MGQAAEGNAQRRGLKLPAFCRPPQKRAGLMAWKNGRQSQGSASSALGFILPPSQKAAGLGSAFNDRENVETPDRGLTAALTASATIFCAVRAAFLLATKKFVKNSRKQADPRPLKLKTARAFHLAVSACLRACCPNRFLCETFVFSVALC